LVHVLAEQAAGGLRQDALKVLFLGHTGQLGGAEIMLEHMATGLRAEGMEPVVALGSGGPLVDRLRSAGVAAHVLPLGSLADARRQRVPVGHRLALDGLNWVRAVRRLIRASQVDVVVTNSQKAHLAGSVAARTSGAPVVWRLHDIVEPTTFGAAQILALRVTAALSRPRVLGVSAAVDAAARETLRIANSSTLHNGVDRSRLLDHGTLGLRDRFGWPPESVVFGTLGRLVRWKGGLEFAQAARTVIERAPLARFVLVGDEMIDAGAGFRDEILGQVEQLGLADSVRLLPFTDDVGAVLAELDVLVQPSTEPDPFPTAVVEAAVVGVPVIASKCGGVGEIIVDGLHGRLVEPRSIPALSRACVDLALDQVGRARMAAALRRDSAGLTVEHMCAGLARELRLAAAEASHRQ
jgi:glycosyltransferase involved in cell wall biosynthesis